MTTVYLYNVGTGKYLNIGSNWGTSVSAYEVGMPVRLTKNADGTYLIQGSLETSDGKYLGFLIRQHQVLLMKRKLTGIVSTVTGKQIILILNGQLQRRVLVARRTGSTATMVVERTWEVTVI